MIDETDRRRPITAAQWAHARAVSEGAPPTRDRIAGILDCNVTAIYELARAEGWKRLDFRRAEARAAHADFIELASRPAEEGEAPEGEAESLPDPAGAVPAGTAEAESGAGAEPVELLRRGTALLARRLSSLLERAEKGGRLNRAEFDGLAAMARVIERWEALAQESVRQEEKKSDEELAEIYRRIDRRIVELARWEAERLVAAGYQPGVGLGGGEELADPGSAGAADDLAGAGGAG